MRTIPVLLLLVLGLQGCADEPSRAVYACKGPWQRIVLEEDGRALVTTAAGVREATYVTRNGTVSIAIPTLAPVDLEVDGNRLKGGGGISCEKVLAD